MIVVGIDPGATGAVALIDSDNQITVLSFRKHSFQEIFKTFRAIFQLHDNFSVWLEQIHATPGSSSKSTTSFVTNWGMIQGFLIALDQNYNLVSPQKWQKKILDTPSRGDKTLHKIKAEEIFPEYEFHVSEADAVLIAEYGRRMLD